MKSEILGAAKSVLVKRGLTAWTIEDVAREAQCAKGLVNYHYKTKANLLAQVGESLREDRIGRRLAALENEGATALDALWNTLTAEVRSGELAAWLSLSALPDQAVHHGLRSQERAAFSSRCSMAMKTRWSGKRITVSGWVYSDYLRPRR
jgi:AcrR family transcriptional regulator